MPIPKPGASVRGSSTGRPIMALLDLLGRRWALRVLWELCDGPETFRGLRARCDEISPSVLNTRLRELRSAGVVSAQGDVGYTLTRHGLELLRALKPLSGWAKAWARREPGRGHR